MAAPLLFSLIITSGGGLNVNVTDVMKTPQFWMLFGTSTFLCTGGMGLMSVAKPMIGEVFTRYEKTCFIAQLQ